MSSENGPILNGSAILLMEEVIEMKRLYSVFLFGSGVLAYGYGRNQLYLIDRVMTDLNRAAERARLDGHERKHFDEVAGNLQEFEARWARGKFDTGKLDKAIHNLEHLAEADRVRGRDRDMLAEDLEDLRELRASRGGYDQNPNYYPNWR
jgi:hypothetical protein